MSAPRENLWKIISQPCVSEKSTQLGANQQYVFKVQNSANKHDVKKAIESMFQVKVLNVNICNMKAKIKRFGQIMGKRKGWKKAYVTLQEGNKIDFGTKA